MIRLMMILMISLGLTLSACDKDGINIKIPDVDGPNVSLDDTTVKVDITFLKLKMDGMLRYNIPELPNSYVEVFSHPEHGATSLLFALDIEDILDFDFDKADPLTLPGGRPLPGVNEGRLPAVAFSLPQFENITFYAGTEIFGFFVSANLGFQNSIATFRYYITDERAGNISLVGEDENGENSGILLLLDIDIDIRRKLRRYLDYVQR